MADAVLRAGPLLSDLRTPHHSAPLSIAGAGVGIIAGILVLALGQQQHGPRKGRRAAMWRSEASARSRILGVARGLNVRELPGTTRE
jgi:hypothetical protein